MTTMTATFDSVKISSDRFVNVGHEVENFGRKCVILGWNTIAEGFVVRAVGVNGKLIGGKWVAEPKLCR